MVSATNFWHRASKSLVTSWMMRISFVLMSKFLVGFWIASASELVTRPSHYQKFGTFSLIPCSPGRRDRPKIELIISDFYLYLSTSLCLRADSFSFSMWKEVFPMFCAFSERQRRASCFLFSGPLLIICF